MRSVVSCVVISLIFAIYLFRVISFYTLINWRNIGASALRDLGFLFHRQVKSNLKIDSQLDCLKFSIKVQFGKLEIKTASSHVVFR